MFPKINPLQTKSWQLLTEHRAEMAKVKMKDLFRNDPEGLKSFPYCSAIYYLIILRTSSRKKRLAYYCSLRRNAG